MRWNKKQPVRVAPVVEVSVIHVPGTAVVACKYPVWISRRISLASPGTLMLVCSCCRLAAYEKQEYIPATARRSQRKTCMYAPCTTHPRHPGLAPVLLSVGGEGSRDGYARRVGELGQDVHRRFFSLRRVDFVRISRRQPYKWYRRMRKKEK